MAEKTDVKEGALMAEKTDVVVVGSGYAGALAGSRLTQRDDVTVTLINPRPNFVERIRLHQLVGGSHDAVVGLPSRELGELVLGGVTAGAAVPTYGVSMFRSSETVKEMTSGTRSICRGG